MGDENENDNVNNSTKETSSATNDDDNDDNKKNILSRIADSTYFNHANNHKTNNEEEEDDDDSVEFLPLVDIDDNLTSKRRKKRNKKLRQIRRHQQPPPPQHFHSSSTLSKKAPPLRAILLALSLSLILAAFWILDSLKDPMFAVLVGGELGKHQPRAKMVSVCITLILVCTVEFVSYERRKKRKQNEEMRRRRDEDVMDGGGNWTKMSVGTSFEEPLAAEEEKQKRDEAAIPVGIFTTLGLCYAMLFALAAYCLSHHSAFVGSSHDGGGEEEEEGEEETSPSSAWRALGYALYAAVESYGSLTVAAFWSFSNSNLTLQTAEENYGLIIAAAQLGAIGGSTIVALARSGSSSPTLVDKKWYQWNYWQFEEQWSVPSLVLLGCGIMILQVLLMWVYGALFPIPMHEEIMMNGGGGGGCNGEEDYRPVVTKPDAASSHHNAPTIQRPEKKKKREKKKIANGAQEGGDGLTAFMSGVIIILRYNYVLLILGVSCLFEVSLTCLDYEMKLIGWDRFGGDDELPSPHISAGDPDRTEYAGGESYYTDGLQYEENQGDSNGDSTTTFAQFMGHYGQLTNAFSLLLSYFAFPYLMTRYGLRRTLHLFPTLLVCVTVLTYLALPFNLPVLFFSMSLLKAMTYSINDPAKELLYMPTSNTVKFKAKFWIDVVGARIAKAVGSSINNYAGSVERIVRYGIVPSLLTALGLYIACLKAGEQFESLIQRGEVVGWEEDEDIVDNEDIIMIDDNVDVDDDDDIGGRNYDRGYDNNDNENDVYEKDGMVDRCTYDLDLMSSDDGDDSEWESNTSIELVRR